MLTSLAAVTAGSRLKVASFKSGKVGDAKQLLPCCASTQIGLDAAMSKAWQHEDAMLTSFAARTVTATVCYTISVAPS